MAPWYQIVCNDLDWTVDETLLNTMKSKNEEQLKKLDEAILDAEQNLGEMEVNICIMQQCFLTLYYDVCLGT